MHRLTDVLCKISLKNTNPKRKRGRTRLFLAYASGWCQLIQSMSSPSPIRERFLIAPKALGPSRLVTCFTARHPRPLDDAIKIRLAAQRVKIVVAGDVLPAETLGQRRRQQPQGLAAVV